MSKNDLLFRILYPYISHHVLLTPSLSGSTFSSWHQVCTILFCIGPKASHLMGLLQTDPPPTYCLVSPTGLFWTLLAPTCPLELTSISPAPSTRFVLLCSRCGERPWTFAIPVHFDLLPSIYQLVLSASLDTAVCLASAWCRLEVPSSPHLPGATLSLMTNGH